MAQSTKRRKKALDGIDREKRYAVGEAVKLVKQFATAKSTFYPRFDHSQLVASDAPLLLPARLLDRMGPGERESGDGEHGRLAGSEQAERHFTLPLVGRVARRAGWGWCRLHHRRSGTTPTPLGFADRPSPQGGG